MQFNRENFEQKRRKKINSDEIERKKIIRYGVEGEGACESQAQMLIRFRNLTFFRQNFFFCHLKTKMRTNKNLQTT